MGEDWSQIRRKAPSTDTRSPSESGTEYEPSPESQRGNTHTNQNNGSSRPENGGSDRTIDGIDTIKARCMYLINHEFRLLQLDKSVATMSVFDLIDHCATLFEQSTIQAAQEANAEALSLEKRQKSEKDTIDDALKVYVRSFLIFNYFVNTFIMLHFNGFSRFMQQAHQDFIIYLNLYNFYKTDDILGPHAFHVEPNVVRKWVIEYLTQKRLLSFDVDLLYTWLDDYIDYLKNKEEYDNMAQSLSANGTAQSSIKESPQLGSETPKTTEFQENFAPTSTGDASEDDLFDFNSRFPELSISSPRPDASIGKSAEKFPPIPLPRSPNTRHLLNFSQEHTARPGDQPPYPVSETVSNSATKTAPYPTESESDTADRSLDSTDLKILQTPHDSVKAYARVKPDPPAVPSGASPFKPHINAPAFVQAPQSSVPQTYVDPGMPRPYAGTGLVPIKGTDFASKQYPTNAYSHDFSRGEPNNHLPYQNPSLSHSYADNPGHSGPVGSQYAGHHNPASNRGINARSHRTTNSFSDPPPIPVPHAVPSQSHVPEFVSPHSHYRQHNGQHNGQYNGAKTTSPQRHQDSSRKMARKMNAVCGLKNLGSSCYINSTVQVLVGLQKFEHVLANRRKWSAQPLSDATAGLITTFNANGGANIAPTKFLRTLSLLKPDFNVPFEQQDAQEFLLFLLDKLHEEMASVAREEPVDYISKWNITVNSQDKEEYLKWYKDLLNHEGESAINDTFQGHIQSQLKCNKCGHRSVSYSPFTILSLPIPAGNNQTIDLTDCLRYYTQDEVLTGENAWNCPKCNKSSDKENPMDVVFQPKRGLFRLKRAKSPSKKQGAHAMSNSPTSISIKQLSFIKLPPVMFIHLSRFSMVNVTDKLNTVITYPLRLKFNHVSHDIYYSLTGIINHFGTLKSGHYTSLVNKTRIDASHPDSLADPLWCYFDDDSVRFNVPHGNVHLRDQNKLNSRDVYVLCYERVV